MRESEMVLMAPVEAKRGAVVTDMESGRSRNPGLTRVTEKERNYAMPVLTLCTCQCQPALTFGVFSSFW